MLVSTYKISSCWIWTCRSSEAFVWTDVSSEESQPAVGTFSSSQGTKQLQVYWLYTSLISSCCCCTFETVPAASFSSPLGAATMQQLFEKVPEFCVENCVDDGVESAVDVAEPRYHAHQRRWDLTVLTAGPQGVKDKEGSPAEQEGTCGNRRGKEVTDWSVPFFSLPDFLLIAIVSEFSGQLSGNAQSCQVNPVCSALQTAKPGQQYSWVTSK